jgi:hypothetical protein
LGDGGGEEGEVLAVLEDLPDNVIGVIATGKVTDDDYEHVLIPTIRSALDAHERIRFFYVLGDEFDGWSLGPMWGRTPNSVFVTPGHGRRSRSSPTQTG